MIANPYYNKEIKNNKDKDFQVEVEYTITIGYENDDDLDHQCYKASPVAYFNIGFADLMKIFYRELIAIVRYDLHDLNDRIEFCKK